MRKALITTCGVLAVGLLAGALVIGAETSKPPAKKPATAGGLRNPNYLYKVEVNPGESLAQNGPPATGTARTKAPGAAAVLGEKPVPTAPLKVEDLRPA